MTEYVQVGKIINTHGLRGFLKVIPLTDDPKRYDNLDTVYVEDEELKIEKVWYNKGLVMVKFYGYDSINDVIKYKNKFILIDAKDSLKLPENSYFIYQIIGLNVYDKKHNLIGKIIDVLQPGGNDVYVVKNANGKECYIPAVKEFVEEINLDENIMIINPIEGMI